MPDPRSAFACCLLALAALVSPACGDDDDDGAPPDAGAPDAASSEDGGDDGGQADPLVVQTAAGPVRGTEHDGVRAFLGIPYAAPPVGERRWQPPALPEAWTEPRDASVAGPPCPQTEMLGNALVEEAREDCLTTNVWVPADATGPLPVMVWIHGGGFVNGGGGEALYDGTGLVSTHDVVLVSLNYRLGPLGFLALPGLGAGEAVFGLLDQRAALEWVQQNVAAFGGDPARVTIFGESAGAMSVCMHLVSPDSEGLYSAALMESGSCAIPLTSLETARTTGAALAAAVEGEGDDPIACLRGVEANTLVTALEVDENASFLESFIWFPPVDGVVLADQPAALFEAGSFADVPIVLGTNRAEGAIFARLGYSGLDEAGYAQLVRANVGAAADDVLARYSATEYGSVEGALTAVLTDGIFTCPTRKLAVAADAAAQDVFLYEFAYELDFPLLAGLGAFHGSEIPFVFGNGLYGLELSEVERTLVAEMQGYWTRFAADHDPNDPAATPWPAWHGADRQHLVLDLPLPLEGGVDLRAEACDFWDGVELSR